MIFYSFSINFDFKILVHPNESHIAIAAEDGHHSQMPTTFEPPLEAFIGARGVGGVWASSRVTVKVRQELVAKLLKFDQHVVRRRKIANDSHGSTPLVSEFGALIEHENAFNFRAGDEEKLLVLICRQLLVAVMQKKRTDRIAPGTGVWPSGVLRLNQFQTFYEFVCAPNFSADAGRAFAMAGGLIEAVDQFLALLDKQVSFFLKVSCFH